MNTLLRLWVVSLWCGTSGISWAALDIQFDYRYDTNGFFSGANAQRKTLLNAAAAVFEQRIQDNFSALIPGGQNTWSLTINNPATGSVEQIQNPVVAANTLTIYVAARDLGDNLGRGGAAGYSYSGTSQWAGLFDARNTPTNFDPVAGTIAFNTGKSWYVDTDLSTVESFPGQQDFYSVAVHELEHVLGFSINVKSFNADVSGANFVGAHAEALYGGPVPLDVQDSLLTSHWEEGLTYHGQETAMDSTLTVGDRKYITELDFAALQDIGYSIAPAVATSIVLKSISRTGTQVTLAWTGGRGPYQVQQRQTGGGWQNVGGETSLTSATFTALPDLGIFRVAGFAN